LLVQGQYFDCSEYTKSSDSFAKYDGVSSAKRAQNMVPVERLSGQSNTVGIRSLSTPPVDFLKIVGIKTYWQNWISAKEFFYVSTNHRTLRLRHAF
jgi:hypothetical protein